MTARITRIGIGAALILVAVIGLLITRPVSQPAAGSAVDAKAARPAAPNGAVSAAAALQELHPADKILPNGARIISEVKHDLSPPLRDIPPAPAQAGQEENEQPYPFKVSTEHHKDAVVQNFFGPLAMPTPILTFEGISFTASGCGCYPPDTNGDVGPNHYIQTVNAAFEIWDKNGTVLQTPRQINTLFTGFGGPCEIHNDGDPVVLYDQQADRWFISQFTS